ncbi:MAG: CsgG/HfaB family protein [Gemmatimonadaceae bacterium]
MQRCTLILATLAAGVVSLAGGRASAQPGGAAAVDSRPTVAVMYFGNGAIGAAHQELAPLSRGIADLLVTELSRNPGIRVIERDQLQKLMDEQNLSATDRVSRETAVQMGRILGVHHMIFGGFVTDGRGAMRLDARAVNVETSQIEHVETVEGQQENLMSMISALAGKLNRGMKLPEMRHAARDAGAERARSVPFRATLLYSRALQEKDSGNEQRALELLDASLAQFPDYEPAQRERAKLRPAGSRE